MACRPLGKVTCALEAQPHKLRSQRECTHTHAHVRLRVCVRVGKCVRVRALPGPEHEFPGQVDQTRLLSQSTKPCKKEKTNRAPLWIAPAILSSLKPVL